MSTIFFFFLFVRIPEAQLVLLRRRFFILLGVFFTASESTTLLLDKASLTSPSQKTLVSELFSDFTHKTFLYLSLTPEIRFVFEVALCKMTVQILRDPPFFYALLLVHHCIDIQNWGRDPLPL